MVDFQRLDGGFSTFKISDRNDSWGISHPDVTPIVLMALLTKFNSDHERIKNGKRFVLMGHNENNIWPSFWWDTFLYSTSVNMHFLKIIGEQLDAEKLFNGIRDLQLKNSFEVALLGECVAATNHPSVKLILDKIALKIISLQVSNGSWREGSILRLTYNSCHKPWIEENNGVLYTDCKRLFTTVTCLGFLAHYMKIQ
jgi:hypothetical protein